jgi:hypothetical protein
MLQHAHLTPDRLIGFRFHIYSFFSHGSSIVFFLGTKSFSNVDDYKTLIFHFVYLNKVTKKRV